MHSLSQELCWAWRYKNEYDTAALLPAKRIHLNKELQGNVLSTIIEVCAKGWRPKEEAINSSWEIKPVRGDIKEGLDRLGSFLIYSFRYILGSNLSTQF